MVVERKQQGMLKQGEKNLQYKSKEIPYKGEIDQDGKACGFGKQTNDELANEYLKCYGPKAKLEKGIYFDDELVYFCHVEVDRE